MSTLRKAVESGRRWRYPGCIWQGPGTQGQMNFSTAIAIMDCYEIEPEPEKPKEWLIHDYGNEIHVHIPNCGDKGNPIIRVHDADACARLHAASAGGGK